MQGVQPDAETAARLETAVARCISSAAPRHAYAFFDVAQDAQGLYLPQAQLRLPGSSIAAHLTGARQCALMAVTLGMQTERVHRALEASGSMTQLLLFDAACSAYAEYMADVCQNEVAEAAARCGLQVRGRFSPGYGDLPLQVQPGLLAALDAGRRLGITLTDSLLMIPRKSITAIVALTAAQESGEA